MLALGILLMARGVFTSGEDRKLLALCPGLCPGDGDLYADRRHGRADLGLLPAAYVAWVFVADGLIFTLGMVALRGIDVIPRNPHAWRLGTLASAASYGAYAVSIWAMTIAPIALVAALRETSILFAVLIGWLVFGERMSREKAIAAGGHRRRGDPVAALSGWRVNLPVPGRTTAPYARRRSADPPDAFGNDLLHDPGQHQVERGQRSAPNSTSAPSCEIDPGRPAGKDDPQDADRQRQAAASVSSASGG